MEKQKTLISRKMSTSTDFSRRKFLKTVGITAGTSMLAAGPILSFAANRKGNEKMKVALVGTGVRGCAMFGRDLMRDYGEFVDLVGICDTNPGRVAYAHRFINPSGPAFTDLDEMLARTTPEWLIVASWDSEHHNNILTGLNHGCNIICEKPITIDEQKAQIILDAEEKYGKEILVTFNLRWTPEMSEVKKLLVREAIGDVKTVDFHWNISRNHMMRYMQRWHGESDKGGTLWVHKSTHHFDLVNWWLDSEPVEVFAYADLAEFGSSGPFRGENCRNCAHTSKCPYYWDITKNEHLTQLYTENEHYDGYIRDNCVFRDEIDIYDQHSAVVKYANNVKLNYSLTGDTDHPGIWIAFNGTKGRIEGRVGGWAERGSHHEWLLKPLGKEPEVIKVIPHEGGHSGGDPLLKDKLFKNPDMPDTLHQSAGTRDGIMSVLIGVAARKSVESGQPVRIEGLTSLIPQEKRSR
jgi:predicted dehydrogenase